MPLIGQKELELPLIQGGMGVGVSLGNLAGHVAAQGGMGVISTVNAGYARPDFERNPLAANLTALHEEIARAKDIAAGRGLVAVNVMVATTHYAETVRTAIEAGVDAIISGAGLPTELPALADAAPVALAPIVSSGKAARTICRLWERHNARLPDFVVVEGREAGGHLGFSREDLESGAAPTLETLLADVRQALEPFEKAAGRPIPVFTAGGVYTAADIDRFLSLGAAGVQMATRFIATHECDASPAYKQAFIRARREDVRLVKSPVGMPGRALASPLLRRLDSGASYPPLRCNDCLRVCPHKETPYCISRALIEAVKGNWEDGLFFCGSHVWRMDRVQSVRELVKELFPQRRIPE